MHPCLRGTSLHLLQDMTRRAWCRSKDALFLTSFGFVHVGECTSLHGLGVFCTSLQHMDSPNSSQHVTDDRQTCVRRRLVPLLSNFLSHSSGSKEAEQSIRLPVYVISWT